MVAWTAACRHLPGYTTGLRHYRPADRTALASTVVAVGMRPVAAWPGRLLPHIPCQDAGPRQPAATHTRTAPLTAEQLYVVAGALLADGGESFVQDHGPAQIARSIQARQRYGPHLWHATFRERTRVRDRAMEHPLPSSNKGKRWCYRRQATRPSYTATPRLPVAHPNRRAVDHLAWHHQARSLPAPCQLAAGADQGLPYGGRPLAAGNPAAHHQRHKQTAGARMGQPPTLVRSPDQEKHLRAAGYDAAIRTTDVLDLHVGPITQARPATTLAVAQHGPQSPKLVVCMFSPAYAQIAVCDPKHLQGPEAVIRVGDCARVIVKALQEGEHHALQLRACPKDNARAAKPGVPLAAALPAHLELQLAVTTTVYHWVQAFHDLQWRGNPDRQIGATHWQEWLQAKAQRASVGGLGPAPTARALDASAPSGRWRPTQSCRPTYPSTRRQRAPCASRCCSLRQGGPHNPQSAPYVQTSSTQAGLCSRTWRGTRCPGRRQGSGPHILQGRARRSPWHVPYAERPPPSQAAGKVAAPEGGEEAAVPAPEADGAPHQGSIPAQLPPLWPPLGAGSPHPMAPAHPRPDPAAMPVRDS